MDRQSATGTRASGHLLARRLYLVHSVEKPWSEKVAQKQNRSHLAVQAASSFMYSPTDHWKIPELGDLFDKSMSMTEHNKEEERSTLEWLQGWGQIKVKPKSRARAQYAPKRPQIVSTAEPPCKRDCGLADSRRRARRR